MRNILNKRERQMLDLIEIIQDNHIYTLSFLEKKLGINTRTLNSLIEDCNKVISPVRIHRKEDGEIALSIEKNCSIAYCYKKMLEQSIEFNMLESLFFDDSLSLNSLADKLYISESTLRRKIQIMNKALLKEGFYIKLIPLSIAGDEKKICNFIIHYIFEKYGEAVNFFQKKQTYFAEQLLSITTKLKNITLSYSDKQKVLIWVLTILNRSRLKKINEQTETQYTEENFFKYSKTILKVNLKNTRFIQVLNFIFQRKLGLSHIQITKEAKTDPKVKSQLSAVEALILETSHIFNIPLPPNKDSLIEKLYFITEIQFGKPYVLYNQYYIFYKEISKYLSTKFEILYKSISRIFVKHNIDLQEYQIFSYIYNLVINWEGFFEQITKSQEKVPIAIFMSLDPEYAELVKQYIDYKEPHKFNFKVLTKFPDENNEYILTITDRIDLKDEYNVLSIAGMPSEKELRWLNKYYEKYVSNN